MPDELSLGELVGAFQEALCEGALEAAVEDGVIADEKALGPHPLLQDVFGRYATSGRDCSKNEWLQLAMDAQLGRDSGDIAWDAAMGLAKRAMDEPIDSPAAALLALRLAREFTPEGERLSKRAAYWGHYREEIVDESTSSSGLKIASLRIVLADPDNPPTDHDHFERWPDDLEQFEVDYYLLRIRAHLELGEAEAALAALPPRSPLDWPGEPEGMEGLRVALARLEGNLEAKREDGRTSPETNAILDEMRRCEEAARERDEATRRRDRTNFELTLANAKELRAVGESVDAVLQRMATVENLLLESLGKSIEAFSAVADGEIRQVRNDLVHAWRETHSQREIAELTATARQMVGGAAWDHISPQTKDDLLLVIALRDRPSGDVIRAECLFLCIAFERELRLAMVRSVPAADGLFELINAASGIDGELGEIAQEAWRLRLDRIRNELAHGGQISEAKLELVRGFIMQHGNSPGALSRLISVRKARPALDGEEQSTE